MSFILRLLQLGFMFVLQTYSDCNSYCVSQVNSNSYCKNWLSSPQCQGSTISCASSICDSISPSSTISTSFSSKVDSIINDAYTTAAPMTTRIVTTTVKPITNIVSTIKNTSTTTIASMSCDNFCISLNGNGYCKTYINPPTCFGGNQLCQAPSCSSSVITPAALPSTSLLTSISPKSVSINFSSTLKITTSSTALTTTNKPTTTTSALIQTVLSSCSSMPPTSIPMFIWAEAPSMTDNTFYIWNSYYENMVRFTTDNCANILTNKVIVRTLNPVYPPNMQDSFQVWAPSITSPFYTGFIQKVNPKIKVIFYPYLYDDTDRGYWANFGRTSDPIQGVFAFVDAWNAFLKSVGSPIVISGFVLDNEELVTMPIYLINITPAHILSLKSKYPNIEFSITIGFDQIGFMNNLGSGNHVDDIYLQMYDFYYPTAKIDSTSSSPFLQYINNPTFMSNMIYKNSIVSTVWNSYSNFILKYPSSTINFMWSNQNMATSKSCIFPLNSHLCGINNEFGSWTPLAFNQFILALSNLTPLVNKLPQGIFNYNFTPLSWLPPSLSICDGAGC